MRICTEFDEDAFDFVPPTFLWPEHKDALSKYIKKNPGACYIGKPEAGAQGDGMFLFKDIKDIRNYKS